MRPAPEHPDQPYAAIALPRSSAEEYGLELIAVIFKKWKPPHTFCSLGAEKPSIPGKHKLRKMTWP